MLSRDFCFWLQGFFEVSGSDTLSSKQVAMIRKHLSLVFKHDIDPSMGSESVQEELNEIHNSEPDCLGGPSSPFGNHNMIIRC